MDEWHDPEEAAELHALVLDAERFVREHGEWTIAVANGLMLMGWLRGQTSWA